MVKFDRLALTSMPLTDTFALGVCNGYVKFLTTVPLNMNCILTMIQMSVPYTSEVAQYVHLIIQCRTETIETCLKGVHSRLLHIVKGHDLEQKLLTARFTVPGAGAWPNFQRNISGS